MRTDTESTEIEPREHGAISAPFSHSFSTEMSDLSDLSDALGFRRGNDDENQNDSPSVISSPSSVLSVSPESSCPCKRRSP